jgi:hypothetical protein
LYSSGLNPESLDSSIPKSLNRLFLCLFNYFKIQNPQSAIEFLTPDPPAAEHLKPKTDLYANSVLAQHPNAVGKNAL